MKWLKSLFGNHDSNSGPVVRKQVRAPTIRISSKVVVRPKTDDEEKIRELNSQATVLNDNGDLDAAIEALKKARDLMLTVSTQYPIKQYLRLPLFQQKGGYFEDAVNGCNQLLNKRTHPFEIATIYDKLRLIHQREKLFKESITYAVSSLAWEAFAYKEQDRPYETFQEDAIWIKAITPSLKKLKLEALTKDIVSLCIAYSADPDSAEIDTLTSKVKKLLSTHRTN